MERSSANDNPAPTGGARRGTMTALSNVLGEMMRRWGKEEQFALLTLRQNWRDVAGPVFAMSVEPVSIDGDGRLSVRVRANGAVAMELRGKGKQYRDLLERCREMTAFDLTEIVLEAGRQRTPRRTDPG